VLRDQSRAARLHDMSREHKFSSAVTSQKQAPTNDQSTEDIHNSDERFKGPEAS